jgi:CPA2 family monovalent cation:H+ antiporter-2
MLREHSIIDNNNTFNLKDELPGLEVTSFKLKDDSRFHGSALKDLNLRNTYGATVLAIRRGEQIIANPTGDTQLLSSDTCIVLAKPERLCQLRRFFDENIEGAPSEICTL